MRVRDLAARRARVVDEASAQKTEGVGNAGCPMHPQPRVRNKIKHTSVVTTGPPGSPGIPARNGFTAYFALSPATRLYCHRRLRIWYVKTRLGLRTSARLDASIGASEPHDFTVREPISAKGFDGQKRLSSACHSSAHGPYDPPCHPLTSPDAAASTASRPASVTIAIRPSSGTRRCESVN